jgi:soluble lytic murein transglycosylase
MSVRLSLLVACGLFLIILVPAHLPADIYSYVDKDGVQHFSNVPVDPRFQFKEAEKPRIYIYEDNQRKYDTMLFDVAKKYQLDPKLLKAIVQIESDFNPNAISEDGAMGLMQLMPEKARELNVSNAFNPRENVEAGARYFSWLLRKYGDITMALAAYNAGEEAVATYQGVPPYPETQEYIQKVQARYSRGE